MKKTQLDTFIILFSVTSVSSLPLQAVGRGVAKKIYLLCG